MLQDPKLLLNEAIFELETSPTVNIEQGRALQILAEGALLNPSLTGKSESEINQICDQAIQIVEGGLINPPNVAEYQKEGMLVHSWALAIQIEAWSKYATEDPHFPKMPQFGIGHKEYLRFALQKFTYFIAGNAAANNQNLEADLALEILVASRRINVNPNYISPVIKFRRGIWVLDQLDAHLLFNGDSGLTNNGNGSKSRVTRIKHTGSQQIQLITVVEKFLELNSSLKKPEIKALVSRLNYQFINLSQAQVDMVIESFGI